MKRNTSEVEISNTNPDSLLRIQKPTHIDMKMTDRIKGTFKRNTSSMAPICGRLKSLGSKPSRIAARA
jgi:hypothetical protein